MKFTDVLDQVIDLLRSRGRLTYRFLQLQFDLEDDALEVLTQEIIKGQKLAVDEDGEVLVWAGGPVDPPTSREGASAPTESHPWRSQAQEIHPPVEDGGQKEKAGAVPSEMVEETEEVSTQPKNVAERRQLTVMFADLVGSTQLSGRLDPEDFREIVRAYQVTCERVVRQFEGSVWQLPGDGIVVYFGYPQAHGDDAKRAVHAGLSFLEAMSDLNDRLEADGFLRLGVRIGIHTGLVVVGDVGNDNRHEPLALGEAPNLAARVEGEAETDTMVITEATMRLVEGAFDVVPLGERSLKGVAEPVSLFQVVATREAATGWGDEPGSAPTPLVGRHAELNLLLERWEQVKEGRGQVVLLSGEAGIGKSRIVQALRDRIGDPEVSQLTFRCSPYHRNSAFHPLIQRLTSEVGFRRDDEGGSRIQLLEAFLEENGFELAESVPVFASLLSVSLNGGYRAPDLSAQQQREETQRHLLHWLLRQGTGKPGFSVWEDIHWADPSTLELLGLLVDQAPSTRTMSVLSFRPEFTVPWGNRSHLIQMIINRFTRNQVEELVRWLAGGKPLPSEVVGQVVEKTDGVPLFVEEVTKLLLESDLLRETVDGYELTGPVPAVAIPTTLQDSLMARLDRLSVGKEVAQIGATLGREFSYELLRAVAEMDEEGLGEGLRDLLEAELLFQKGLPPDAKYVFKHALVQDVAYGSLLRKTRQEYHQRIAKVLEERFPETIETQPELMARHATGAGLIEKAISYWKVAGESAIERSAHAEAISHLSKGLELLRELPETPEVVEQEITMQIALGVPLTALRGYGAPEVERAYGRARELCDHLGEAPQMFWALYGMWRFYLLRAEYGAARELGQQLLDLAKGEVDPAVQVAAHRAMGATLFYLGELTESLSHLGVVMSAPAAPEVRNQALLHDVVDAWVTSRSYASWALWLKGDLDAAQEESNRAVNVARELEHPFSLALGLSFASWFEEFQGNSARAGERAREALDISVERGFEFWVGWDQIVESWSRLDGGDPKQEAQKIRDGVTAWRATGSELGITHFMGLLAEACMLAGCYKEAGEALDEANLLIEQTGERFWEAELYRLRGELVHLAGSDSNAGSDSRANGGAKEWFQRALDVARGQGARSLEVRAALSLARLWMGESKPEEARRLLARALEPFPRVAGQQEAPDLMEARRVLKEAS